MMRKASFLRLAKISARRARLSEKRFHPSHVSRAPGKVIYSVWEPVTSLRLRPSKVKLFFIFKPFFIII